MVKYKIIKHAKPGTSFVPIKASTLDDVRASLTAKLGAGATMTPEGMDAVHKAAKGPHVAVLFVSSGKGKTDGKP